MNRLPVIILILLLFAPAVIHGQENVKIDKKEFRLGKEGFREAWDHVKRGDEYYKLGGGLYPEALAEYLAAISYNKNNPELNYKAGVSSLYGDRPDEALQYFLSARDLNPDISTDILLLTGLAYQSKADFGMALDCYNMYSDLGVESGRIDNRVNRYIRQCNLAIGMVGSKADIEVVNLGKGVNSAADDYSPVTANNNAILYFTSRRSSGRDKERNRGDMKYDESIFISTITNGEWSPSGIAGRNIATDLNEGVLYVSNSNDLMFVYAGWSGNGDIFMTEFVRGKWTVPQPLTADINSPARETSFCITGSGDERFFTSDRKKGGSGGRDIWYTRRIKKDKWTRPYNLGSVINSEGNEEGVWVSPGGDTLWFSSNGHEGIGGYDVFVSYRDSLGSWTAPVNLGMPVNSTWDDLFYRPLTGAAGRAHITSNRPGGEGGFDIYELIFNYADTGAVSLPDSLNTVVPDSLALPKNDTVKYMVPGRQY